MLRRQQAEAIIAARERIVEGAVSMVRLALNKLDQDNVVELDEERKAAMVEVSTDQACLKVPKFESVDSRALSFGVVSREYP